MRAVALLITITVTSSATAAGPTCALLDPEKTPRAALLEAKLTAEPNATWVERANIDQVLKEQKLQSAFGPQGVGERVKLGKLLKADVLVMVRPVKDPKEQAIEVVVSETAGGLRLLVRAIPTTSNADADVAALQEAVRAGLSKNGESVKEIIAVPPFVSNDLELTHDHLKGAFAKLVEAEALNRKGVLVVELDEADALAKEIALAAPGAKIERPLPVYLLGEYRHDGKGKDATVTLKLRAERGNKPVGKPDAAVVKPAESPAALRKWSVGVLDAIAKDDRQRPPADAKTEARQIAARSVIFRRLGNWSESLALAEASLLLDPAQADLHADALRALTPLMHDTFMQAFSKDVPGAIAATRRFYTRGLGHMEAFIILGGDLKRYRGEGGLDMVTAFRQSVRFLYKAKNWKPDEKALWDEMDAEERETYLRVIPVLAKLPEQPELIYVQRVISELTPKEHKFPTLEKIILSMKDVPDARRRIAFCVTRSGLAWNNPGYVALLSRLAASEDKLFQTIAGDLKTTLDDLIKNPPRPPKISTDPAGPPAANGPSFVKFKPIELPGEMARSLRGVRSIGPNVDVFWSINSLYLMTKKGVLQQVWQETSGQQVNSGFSSVVFDGKYVWATYLRRQKSPVLLALDPASAKVWDFTTADGLPRAPDEALAGKDTVLGLLATPLEPGRVCLCGSFLGRAWIGTAVLDSATGKAVVKVFHEAREAPDRADKDQWKRTDIAFHPNLLATITGPGPDGKLSRRVFAVRWSDNLEVGYRPLVIDPDAGKVEVFPTRVPNPPWGDRAANTGSAIYFLEHSPHPDRTMHLMRIAYPATEKEIFVEKVSPSVLSHTYIVAQQDGRLQVVIFQMESDFSLPPDKQMKEWSQLWTVPTDGKNPQPVPQATLLTPTVLGLGISSHYGLVAWLNDQPRKRPSSLQQVLIEERPPAPKP